MTSLQLAALIGVALLAQIALAAMLAVRRYRKVLDERKTHAGADADATRPATQAAPSARNTQMPSPKIAMTAAKIAGAPTGCMSHTATSGQPPRSHSRAWSI